MAESESDASSGLAQSCEGDRVGEVGKSGPRCGGTRNAGLRLPDCFVGSGALKEF